MSNFALDLGKFAQKAGKNADKAVKKVCFDLTSAIIFDTPVDTGRLRANWQASIGIPLLSTLDSTDKSGNDTLASTMAAINKAAGNIFYLTNNLPYAYRIEFEGWSKVKAPKGMVRINFENVKNSLF